VNDRRRLLLLSILVTVAVAAACVLVTSYHLYYSAWRLEQSSPPDVWSHWIEACWTAGGTIAVVFVAGGALFLRINQSFIQRLELSEARNRAIIDTAVQAIVTADDRGRVMSFNPAAERLFECRAEEIIGKSLAALVAGCSSALDALDASSTTRSDLVGRRRDGSTFPLEMSVGKTPLGKTLLYTAILRDVTDAKLAEEQTRQTIARLERLGVRLTERSEELSRINHELDDFTCVASHDLKEPLRGIAGYCQLLLEGYRDRLDENGRRMLAALVGLCQRLSQLIDDLLAYSHIGRSEPACSPVEIASVVEDVIDRLTPAVEMRRGVVRIVDDLPRLAADKTLLAEVFQNLITNGLKFNTAETPTVEIGSRSGKPAVIYVRDNGIGIQADHHEAVFEMFRRLHSRRKFEGTGAGLAIVRKIVEAHGGRVWLESQLGQGTTVFFTLEPSPAARVSPPHSLRLLSRA
jgi:PAS domain S-box-containing protein